MITTRESIRQAMTRQQKALERVVSAYLSNNIPVPTRDRRRLSRLSSPRLEALADHWEARHAEAEKEESVSDDDTEDEGAERSRYGPWVPVFKDGEPNLLHPSCPISVMQKVLRRMSGLHGPHPNDRIIAVETRYHGLSAVGVHRVE